MKQSSIVVSLSVCILSYFVGKRVGETGEKSLQVQDTARTHSSTLDRLPDLKVVDPPKNDSVSITATSELDRLWAAGDVPELLDAARDASDNDLGRFLEILNFLAIRSKDTALEAWLQFDGLARYEILNLWLPMVADASNRDSLSAAWDWIMQSFPPSDRDRALMSLALNARDNLPDQTMAYYATLSDGETKDLFRDEILISRYTRNYGHMVAEQLLAELLDRPQDRVIAQGFRYFTNTWYSTSPEACLSMLEKHTDAAALIPELYQNLQGH